jgi:cardiolipin synthase
MTWNLALSALYVVYAVGVTVFLVMDRRNPTSTLAWLLFMLTFPIASLIIYVLAGRSWKAFSRANYYVRKDIGRDLVGQLTRVLPPPREPQRVLQESGIPVRKRLVQLGMRNSYAVVTMNNRVEILQDAETFYPLLLEDLKRATHSIHLEYFSWATDAVVDEFDAVLEQKSREGVEVRLLFDAVGSFFAFKRSLYGVVEKRERPVPVEPADVPPDVDAVRLRLGVGDEFQLVGELRVRAHPADGRVEVARP